MSMNAFHLFLLVFTAAQEAEITVPPQSVNITINQVAVFNCTGVANSFTWRANGQQIDHGEPGVEIQPEVLVNKTQQIRMSTLRMTVTSVENATNITCIAFLWTPISSDTSYPAMLLVQGLLEPVSNLTAAFVNCTTVFISWNPPFTLEGVPILGYRVTITNTTSGENETISVEGDTTTLYYTIAHSDLDNDITVTVVPINELGIGEQPVAVTPTPVPKDSVTSQHSPVSTRFTSILQTNNGAILQFSIATPSVTINSNSSAKNNQTTSESFLITIISSCAVIPVILTIAVTVTVITFCLLLSKKRKSLQSLNKILVDDNPAYEQVTLKQIPSQFEVQDNSAYSTYNPYSIIS